MIKALFLFCFFSTATAFAAGDAKAPANFDVVVAPYFAPQLGSYKAEDIDSGSSTSFQFGARLGAKLGPVFLGGEFGGAYHLNKSTQANVSTADQGKYGADSTGTSLHVGVGLGILTDRVFAVATYYPIMSFDATSTVATSKVTAKYDGIGYGAELGFRIRGRMFLALSAMQREFKVITSGALDKASLDPKWVSQTYGLTLTYVVPFSDFAKLPDGFKAL